MLKEAEDLETLRRKEKRIIIFIVVFFLVGITLTFISWAYYIISLSALPGNPEAMIDFVKSYEFTRQVLYAAGSSLTTTAFILLVYWAYLRGKIKRGTELEDRPKRKRSWKILHPKE